jgi:hypothetical protein
MPAFRQRILALLAIAIAAAAFVYAQQGPERGRGERARRPSAREHSRTSEQEQAQPPERERSRAPQRQHARAPGGEQPGPPAPRKPALQMPDAEILLAELEHANPWEVMNVLMSMRTVMGARLTCHVLGGDMLLVASDEQATLERVRSLVQKLDRPARRKMHTPEIYRHVALRHADAVGVMRSLRELAPDSLGKVRVVADEAANTVWVSGTEKSIAWLCDLAAEMDENMAVVGTREDCDARELRFYRLTHADAHYLSRLLVELAAALDQQATVLPDPKSGTLLAYATPAQHAGIKIVVDQLDVPSQAPQRQPRQMQKPDERRPRATPSPQQRQRDRM